MTGPPTNTLPKSVTIPLHALNRITDLAFMLRRRPATEVDEIAKEIEKIVAGHIDHDALQLDEIQRLGT